MTAIMEQSGSPMIIRNRDKKTRAGLTGAAACLTALFAFSALSFEGPSSSLSRVTVPSGVEALRDHVRYLASEELTGRGIGTPGIKLARDYLAAEFAKSGLQPGGDNGSYLQSFEVVTGVTVKPPTSLSLDNQAPLKLNQDWIPLGFSASNKVEAEAAFVGYGITAKDHGYDDYAGIDVQGKIVVVLRYEPPPKDANSPFRKYPNYSIHAALRTKVNNARDHGAVGMILVDLRDSGDSQELISTRSSLWRGGTSLVAAQAKRTPIEKWLQAHSVSLEDLRDKIDREQKPASMQVPGAKISLQVNLEEVRQTAENVIAVLPGTDPQLRDQHVVIGAHYDHIGLGDYGTRDSSTTGQIHPGADDNASGTAVLLEVGRRLSRSDSRPARTVIFAAFSGEELGLYGSRHYVNHPTAPLSFTQAILNLDMVGRLREDLVTVFGAASGRELSGIVKDAAIELGLKISESDSIGRSDHFSFYNKKVPALHLFTGIHSDYHRPSDTWDKLNLQGMAKISDLVLAITRQIANTNARLEFVTLPSAPPGHSSGEERATPTYLGSIPDYSGIDEGVRLAGVSAGSPAAMAGLRQGDIIVKLAETKIQNLEDLMLALASKKPGDEIEIVVLRGKQTVTLKAVLRARG
jgi:hypothetical protein